MSGVKNLVSNTGALLRGEPFSQVKSPNANGVKLSTPSVASGDCRASGTDWLFGPTSLSFSFSANEGVGALALAAVLGLAAAGTEGCGAAASAGGAAAGAFITRSLRVALLATTVTAGATASGYPPTRAAMDHSPGVRSANE